MRSCQAGNDKMSFSVMTVPSREARHEVWEMIWGGGCGGLVGGGEEEDGRREGWGIDMRSGGRRKRKV